MKPHCISLLSILLLAGGLCAQREMQEFDIDTIAHNRHSITINPIQSIVGTVGARYVFNQSNRRSFGIHVGYAYRTTVATNFDPLRLEISKCRGVSLEMDYSKYSKKLDDQGIRFSFRYKWVKADDSFRTYRADDSPTSKLFPYEDDICSYCRSQDIEQRHHLAAKILWVKRTDLRKRFYSEVFIGGGYRVGLSRSRIITQELVSRYPKEIQLTVLRHFPVVLGGLNIGLNL